MPEEEDESLDQADLDEHEPETERGEVESEAPGMVTAQGGLPEQRPDDENDRADEGDEQDRGEHHLSGREHDATVELPVLGRKKILPPVMVEEERPVVRRRAYVERVVVEELLALGGGAAQQPGVRRVRDLARQVPDLESFALRELAQRLDVPWRLWLALEHHLEVRRMRENGRMIGWLLDAESFGGSDEVHQVPQRKTRAPVLPRQVGHQDRERSAGRQVF